MVEQTSWILAKVGGEEAARVDAESSDLSPDTFVRSSICKLGIDLNEELFDVAEKVAGERCEELLADGVLIISLDDADNVC